MDADLKALITVLLDSQIQTNKAIADLAVTVDRYTAVDVRMRSHPGDYQRTFQW